MICPDCALAADTHDYTGHEQCETLCDCQHRCTAHGKRLCVRCINRASGVVYRKHKVPYCPVCDKGVAVTPKGGVLHYHKDQRFRLRCSGSGKHPWWREVEIPSV